MFSLILRTQEQYWILFVANSVYDLEHVSISLQEQDRASLCREICDRRLITLLQTSSVRYYLLIAVSRVFVKCCITRHSVKC